MNPQASMGKNAVNRLGYAPPEAKKHVIDKEKKRKADSRVKC